MDELDESLFHLSVPGAVLQEYYWIWQFLSIIYIQLSWKLT